MARSRHSIAATRIGLALGAIVFAVAAPALAQIDIAGNWISSEICGRAAFACELSRAQWRAGQS
jgi:hypothetical protein